MHVRAQWDCRHANLARVLQDRSLAVEGHRGVCSSFLTVHQRGIWVLPSSVGGSVADEETEKWGMSADEYLTQAVKNVKAELVKIGKKLSTRASTPMAQGT